MKELIRFMFHNSNADRCKRAFLIYIAKGRFIDYPQKDREKEHPDYYRLFPEIRFYFIFQIMEKHKLHLLFLIPEFFAGNCKKDII